jgi:branched-chain amino acid transport system permease protein
MSWGNHTKYYLLLLAVLGVIPFIVPPFYAGLTVKILLLAIFAMSLDILLGYTGLFSFGHVIGWGVGGYTVGILVSLNLLHNFWALLGLGLLIAFCLNAILGFLALRTSALYFALVTLSFAELLRSVALKWRDFTGGVDGISGIPKPWEMGEISFYYFVLAFFLLCLVLMRLLVDSRFGQVLVGIRENEPRMQLMGYNTWIYKYLALLFTGVMATIAGVLFCYDTGYVGPGDLGFGLSGQGLLMVLIGGMGTLVGPFIGAVVLVILSDILSTYSSHWMFILGTIFVLSVLIIPKGIGGYFIKS